MFSQSDANVFTWIVTAIELVIRISILMVVLGNASADNSLTTEKVLAAICVLLKLVIFFGLVFICRDPDEFFARKLNYMLYSRC